MRSSQRGNTQKMDIILYRLAGSLKWSEKHGTQIHIKAHIRKGRSNYPESPVVPILTQLNQQNPGPATRFLFKLHTYLSGLFKTVFSFHMISLYTSDQSILCL